MTALPRLVVAAAGSGHGKTTVATGLMGALRARGLTVAGAKVGPDYIDPGYHALATGRPGRNLDPHLCGEQLLPRLLLHAARTPTPADVAVVEGVMGLYDGRIGGRGYASTAHVARLLDAPVLLVLDASHLSRTAAALVHGLRGYDPALRLAGVVLNKTASPRHVGEVADALAEIGVEVLGVLPRDAGVEAPSRHLGLVPAAERDTAEASVRRLSDLVGAHLDLDAILAVARSAAPLDAEPWSPEEVVAPPSAARPVVAVAAGRAFTFRYAETDELLRAAGCEPVPFDPLTDRALPAGTAGLYLGGGFPEVHAVELAGNASLRAEIRAAVADGLPTVAECAGLLYLCRSVDGHPMVGAVDAEATMTSRLTLAYRTAEAAGGLAGEVRAAAHEFHRTTVTPAAGPTPAWRVDGEPVGFAGPALHASYLHLHWAGSPALAQRFADAVHARAAAQQPDLDHHGDRDLGEGLVDLAVNVRVSEPPRWLAEVVAATVTDLAAYPRTDEAAKAIAAAHGVSVDQVLPTAGGAEAFTLLARAIRARRAVVVHPQFTEPEAALRAAGQVPDRVLLRAADGFALDEGLVDDTADLVMVGNPTNPTGTLHPAAVLRALLRPDRVLVVDEAFMDAVPGEPETLIGPAMPGLLVLRSLTKTWGLAGLRAGYVVGDPALIGLLRAQQPPWSVSTPALAATVACLAEPARAEADRAARDTAVRRADLVARLAGLGLPVAGRPATPFVLVDTEARRGARPAGWVREALRTRGFAVRRGDSFPGLGPDWIRLAVRDRATHAALGDALREVLG